MDRVMDQMRKQSFL